MSRVVYKDSFSPCSKTYKITYKKCQVSNEKKYSFRLIGLEFLKG